MNLVQINERLKDLPPQVLQQYANGMNPEVPPYLALGELQRRELSAKQMATAQGAAQGPQPSVKEQVEQKAGLMALQQMQQQQLAQQMSQPRGPMPAPAEVPQPEAQPEAAMMARGGLAAIPVRRDMFEYAGGGIIAFQSGGKTPRIQDEVPISEEERERLQRELLMRLVGEEARNPPVRRPPMEMTEQDLVSIPGLAESDLMARALANAKGPQPDNRALLNQIDARDARRTATLEREAAKAAARPKYETSYDRMTRKNRGELTEEERKQQEARDALISQIPKDTNIVEGGQRVSGSELGRNVGNTLMALPGASVTRALSGSAGSSRGVAAGLTALLEQQDKESAAPTRLSAPISRPTTQMTPQQMEAKMSSGLPSALPKPSAAPPSAGPRPAPSAATGAAPASTPKALPDVLEAVKTNQGSPASAAATTQKAPDGQTPLMPEALAAVREKPVAPTPESIIAEQAKLLPASMQEAAVKRMIDDQRARAKTREEAYQSSRPSGLDDLIRVFGQAGQYKGLSGMGPAYTANLDRKRAEDAAFQKQQDELLTAIEGRDYAAAEKLFTARQGSLTEAQKAYQTRLTSNTKALADLAGIDQRRIEESAQRLTNLEIAKLQNASANRPGEAERINAEYLSLKAKNKPAEAEAYLERMLKIKGNAAASGIPKPMTRDQASDNVEKALENFATAKTTIADAKAALAAAGLKDPTMAQIKEHLIQEQMRGVSLSGPAAPATGAPPSGKVPPPPPGFKVN